MVQDISVIYLTFHWNFLFIWTDDNLAMSTSPYNSNHHVNRGKLTLWDTSFKINHNVNYKPLNCKRFIFRLTKNLTSRRQNGREAFPAIGSTAVACPDSRLEINLARSGPFQV